MCIKLCSCAMLSVSQLCTTSTKQKECLTHAHAEGCTHWCGPVSKGRSQQCTYNVRSSLFEPRAANASLSQSKQDVQAHSSRSNLRRSNQPYSTCLLVFAPLFTAIRRLHACRPKVCENRVQYTLKSAWQIINTNNVIFHQCFVPYTNQVDSLQPNNSSDNMRSCVYGRAIHVSKMLMI